MKTILLFSLIVSASASAETVCRKEWTAFTRSNEILQAGMLISKMENTSLRIRDLDGKNERVVQLPRVPGNLVSPPAMENALLYYTNEGSFIYDLKTKQEKPFPLDLKTGGLSIQKYSGSVISVDTGDDKSGVKILLDQRSGQIVPVDRKAKVSVNGSSFMTQMPGSDKVVLSSLKNPNEKTEVSIPAGSTPQLDSKEKFSIYNSAHSGKPINYVRSGAKWSKVPEVPGAFFSGQMQDGSLIYYSYTPKPGRNPGELSIANIRDFDTKIDIYDSEAKKKTLSSESKNLVMTTTPGLYTTISSQFEGVFDVQNSQSTTYSENEFKKMLKGEKATPIATNTGFLPAFGFQDSDWGSIAANGKSIIYNKKTGDKFEVPGTIYQVTEAADGGKLLLGDYSDQTLKLSEYDLKTKKLTELGNQIVQSDPNFKKYYTVENGRLVAPERICHEDHVQVISDDCGCLVRGTDMDSNFQKTNFQENQKIVLQTFCQAPFSTKEWDSIAPAIAKGNVSEKQALIYLKRFQKSGGYNSAFFPIMGAILKSPLVEKQPRQIEFALQAMASADPDAARFFLNAFHLPTKLGKIASGEDTARCDDPVTKANRESLSKSLNALAAQSPEPSFKSRYDLISLFRSDFQKLPAEQRTAMVDNIAEGLSQKAASDAELKGLFQSKLYYFAKKQALALMGMPAKDATDLSLAISSGKQAPVILASDKIKGNSETATADNLMAPDPERYGFTFKRLPELSLPKDAKQGAVFQKDYQWETNHGKFTAQADIKVLEPLADLIKKDPTPPYKLFKADKKMIGMMIIGQNLSGDVGLVDEYIRYYQNQNYEFKPVKEINTVEFFKTQVSSGNLDYLIKEAHSDGDENNLFRASSQSNMLEGRKKNTDGTEEIIYLLGPSPTSKDSKLISNQEFGEWIRSRKETEPLAYFNTSCTSTRKVIAEIGAAHTKNFLPYPSASLMYTFGNHDGSSMKLMMDGFLGEKSYEAIRQEMKRSPKYASGSDQMLFPDDPLYQTQILANLKMNLDTKITVKDSSGKVMNIDEQIDHD